MTAPVAASATSRPPLAGPAHSSLPGGQVTDFALGYVFQRLYAATVGPKLRQATSRILGEPSTKPFIPPLTPGYAAREVAAGVIGTVATTKLLSMALRTSAASVRSGALLSANGLVGVNATAAATAGAAAVAGAMRAMVGRTLLLSAAGAVIDEIMARYIGPKVEGTVNRSLGIKAGATNEHVRGGVPLNAVRQTLEQRTRQFSRSFLGGVVFTVLWKEFGMGIARSVMGAVGGPAGAVIGAITGTLLTSTMNHAVMWAVGPRVADTAQAGVRLLKESLGMKLDPRNGPREVVATMGDRVAGNLGSVMVPFALASATGRQDMFVRGLVPVA